MNLISLDNGRGGLGGANAVGVNINSTNTDLTLTNMVSDFGATQTTDIAIGANNLAALVAPKFRTSTGGGNCVRSLLAKTTATKTFASANPLNIPWYGDIFRVTDTTGFNAIPASYDGRRITLRFDNNLTIFIDGNIELQANTNVGNGSTVDLICDGTNWYRAG